MRLALAAERESTPAQASQFSCVTQESHYDSLIFIVLTRETELLRPPHQSHQANTAKGETVLGKGALCESLSHVPSLSMVFGTQALPLLESSLGQQMLCVLGMTIPIILGTKQEAQRGYEG